MGVAFTASSPENSLVLVPVTYGREGVSHLTKLPLAGTIINVPSPNVIEVSPIVAGSEHFP